MRLSVTPEVAVKETVFLLFSSFLIVLCIAVAFMLFCFSSVVVMPMLFDSLLRKLIFCYGAFFRCI